MTLCVISFLVYVNFPRLVMAIRLGLNHFIPLCLNADTCILNGDICI